jgi:hypothetical protein
VPCPTCHEFCEDVRIDKPDTLEGLLATVWPAVHDGHLTIVSGSLARDDYMVCDLSCPSCGQRFELRCETYHGRGGQWRAAQGR